ncbi:molybdenum cofactor biosynthesis protein MoaB [Paenibacillus dokdonensis]|uniref:Molybdenum cofactor biosynthesis protein B n=1 Tax=Paenibacillus dokdonensis TaxID=2567944 RepID=A0ABU6GL23_9BACL|nr:molybdenum cofactor biosynthesis protein B [Paenibacillus dokdonensis]MEC0240437.1 molybdenum cofactor biosynthesis protein MoaB [Paenibacillus dokdonensis]
MKSVDQHRSEAPETVSCMIVTVSDTRTPETDSGGQLIKSLLEEAGHQIVGYEIVKDDYEGIRELIHEATSSPDVKAVILTGGTGISPRDTTYEAVSSLLDKQLPGFGEIFRYLSFTEDIGAAAILSRAIAGTSGGKAVFSIPGSTGAVKLAMERIIVPEIGHVMREIHKKE